MKRVPAILLIALLLLPSGLIAMSRKVPVHISHPVVGDVTGDVMVKGPEQSLWEPVDKGTLLFAGDVIKSSFRGKASIRFASGTIEMYEDTEIQIPSIGDLERKKDIREILVSRGSVLLDIGLQGANGSFIFRTVNTHGQVDQALLTISYLGAGTAVNVYQGETRVSRPEEYPETITSLIPGSSLRVEQADPVGKLVRFDPLSDQKNFRKGILPQLNKISGLFVEAQQATMMSEISHSNSGVEGADPARDAVTPMNWKQGWQ